MIGAAISGEVEVGIVEKGRAEDITRRTDPGVGLRYVSSTKTATSIADIEISGSGDQRRATAV
jgi:hypothetical protein